MGGSRFLCRVKPQGQSVPKCSAGAWTHHSRVSHTEGQSRLDTPPSLPCETMGECLDLSELCHAPSSDGKAWKGGESLDLHHLVLVQKAL